GAHGRRNGGQRARGDRTAAHWVGHRTDVVRRARWQRALATRLHRARCDRPRARCHAEEPELRRLPRCTSACRRGWDHREPDARHCGGRKRARQDRVRGQGAVAVGICNDRQWTTPDLQPFVQQLDDLVSRSGPGSRRDRRSAGWTQRSLMLTVPEASARILEHITPLAVERVALLDALGRVLAEPVRAPMTLPAWDNSAMDGYAGRGGGT